jgi:hypothetical protein
MNYSFEIIRTTRKNFLKLIEGLTDEQLNNIPAGFNNNIIWNFGHIIVTQQTLCYVRMGFNSNIAPSLNERFRKGSKPEQPVTKEEIALLKKELKRQIDQLEEDIQAGLFLRRTYEQLPTSYGITINTLDDAVRYLATHDALHYGYALAQQRQVKSQN